MLIIGFLPILIFILACPTVSAFGDSMIGPGVWSVLSVDSCEGEFPAKFEVTRHKLNRSHDGFNVLYDFPTAVDDSFSIQLDICKKVDGGCKPYHSMGDANLPSFVRRYVGDNVRAFLERAGVEPPDFPVPEGTFSVSDFVYNYAELPPEGIYGAFGVRAAALRAGAELTCVRLETEFAEDEHH